MTTYGSTALLADTLEITGESYAAADMITALQAASRVIDSYKGTQFFPTSSTCLYTADPCNPTLQIDDVNSLNSVNVDMDGDGTFEVTWANGTDFYLEPINAGLIGVPFDQITIRRMSGKVWPPYQYAVQVIGSFGWATAPPQVTQACTILAGRYLKRARETPYGIVTVGSDALAAARLGKIDPDVAFMLDELDADAPRMIL